MLLQFNSLFDLFQYRGPRSFLVRLLGVDSSNSVPLVISFNCAFRHIFALTDLFLALALFVTVYMVEYALSSAPTVYVALSAAYICICSDCPCYVALTTAYIFVCSVYPQRLCAVLIDGAALV